MRGNLPPFNRETWYKRSIPACAGEPHYHGFQPCDCAVYPRVCGGTDYYHDLLRAYVGLSPRVRGNPLRQDPSTGRPRSIPACAGEPLYAIFSSSEFRVYPRVCGGTPISRCHTLWMYGLSPRVRGNLILSDSCTFRDRSIPACAGEPRSTHWTQVPCRVYPRVCGGTVRPRPPVIPAEGLSPRVRGNLGIICRLAMEYRSIPACAGEPQTW